MSNQAPRNSSIMPWPLTFDEFTFGTRVYNTLRCNIIFEGHQFALPSELDQPSGEPVSPDWKNDWAAGFIVADYRMPPGPVAVRWTALDGVERAAEIDLIDDIFPDRKVWHNVPKEDVNEDWARYEGGKTLPPQIFMEVNDRTVRVYMSAMVLTKLPPDPSRPDIVGRDDLVLVWSRSY